MGWKTPLPQEISPERPSETEGRKERAPQPHCARATEGRRSSAPPGPAQRTGEGRTKAAYLCGTARPNGIRRPQLRAPGHGLTLPSSAPQPGPGSRERDGAERRTAGPPAPSRPCARGDGRREAFSPKSGGPSAAQHAVRTRWRPRKERAPHRERKLRATWRRSAARPQPRIGGGADGICKAAGAGAARARGAVHAGSCSLLRSGHGGPQRARRHRPHPPCVTSWAVKKEEKKKKEKKKREKAPWGCCDLLSELPGPYRGCRWHHEGSARRSLRPLPLPADGRLRRRSRRRARKGSANVSFALCSQLLALPWGLAAVGGLGLLGPGRSRPESLPRAAGGDLAPRNPGAVPLCPACPSSWGCRG